jgi:predicted Na+-dependent transporter
MLKYHLKKSFWGVAFVALLAGFYFPQYGAVFHGKENVLIMGIIFFNFLGVGVRELLESIKRSYTLALVILVLSGVFAAIIFINREYFSEEVFAGLILASTSGISFSSLLVSNIFSGDKARLFILSLVSLTVSAFVIPLFFPELNTFDILLDTARFLFFPVFFAGLFRLSPYGEYIEKHGSYFSILLFGLMIYSFVSSFSSVHAPFYIFAIAVAFNLINIFFGVVIGKNKAEKISYGVSSILRNYELPLLITLASFKAETSTVLMVFMIVSYIFVTPSLFVLLKFKK